MHSFGAFRSRRIASWKKKEGGHAKALVLGDNLPPSGHHKSDKCSWLSSLDPEACIPHAAESDKLSTQV